MTIPSGFISARAAASRLSRFTRQKGLHSLDEDEARKVFRELETILIPSDVKLMTKSLRGRWVELSAADRLNGFRITYIGEGAAVGAETCRVNGAARELIIQTNHFDELVSPPRPKLEDDALVDFAWLKDHHFPFSEKTLERREMRGTWPKRVSAPGTKKFYLKSEAIVALNKLLSKP